MIVVDRKRKIDETPQLIGERLDQCSLRLLHSEKSIDIFELNVEANRCNLPLTIKWKTKAKGVKGSWSSNVILNKRFRTDWELPQLSSSISVDAPIISLFGHLDENILAVACSDSQLNIQMELSYREEDNHFYCGLHFFNYPVEHKFYTCRILIDKSSNQFSEVIQRAAGWVTENSDITPIMTPPMATVPLYSTWYSFHQNLLESELIEECKIAKNLGYGLIIIDDGWQTLDDNRGYEYTGDWEALRIRNMSGFVDDIHSLDMAIMLWYSVPFCGVKSKAYKKFKGKFLTENHHWAPVFDPRFPEVRAYLIGLYTRALIEWDLDGFKLDFIDDFKVYPETELSVLNGRDTLSVTEGTARLISGIRKELIKIKSDVLIEFRQKYISPALRHLGNMFRAFDCPNDSLMNRVRTTDVKLICGEAAVHSDMLTWNTSETVEIAALQFTSILFSVPQLSVRLAQRDPDTLSMIRFFTSYWNKNKYLLLKGQFEADKPMSNYPTLSVRNDHKLIIGVYDDIIVRLKESRPQLDLINGKLSKTLIIDNEGHTMGYDYDVHNCVGELIDKGELVIKPGINQLACPANGIMTLKKNQK